MGSVGEELRDDITTVFNILGDGQGTLESDLNAINAAFGISQIEVEALLDKLIDTSYLIGQVGQVDGLNTRVGFDGLTNQQRGTDDGSQRLRTSGRFFGVDIGGAELIWDDGILGALANFGESGSQATFLVDPGLNDSDETAQFLALASH